MELIKTIGNNEFPKESSKAFELNLSGQFDSQESPEIIEEISKSLQKNNTLKSLHLANTKLSDKDITLLINSLTNNSSLQILDISNNNITDLGATNFIFMLRENKMNKLKQIHLHHNLSISPNTELLIWNIIASKQLPTALDMIDSKDQIQKNQMNKIKILRKKLLILLNDLQQHENRNRFCFDTTRNVKHSLQNEIMEYHTQQRDLVVDLDQQNDHQIILLDCLSEHCFSCEIDSMLACLEWVWKDSLLHKWENCMHDVDFFLQIEEKQSNSICCFLQHPLFYYETKKMIIIFLSSSGSSLLSLIAYHDRQRITQGLTFTNVNYKWFSFSIIAISQIIVALEYLHHHQITYLLLMVIFIIFCSS